MENLEKSTKNPHVSSIRKLKRELKQFSIMENLEESTKNPHVTSIKNSQPTMIVMTDHPCLFFYINRVLLRKLKDFILTKRMFTKCNVNNLFWVDISTQPHSAFQLNNVSNVNFFFSYERLSIWKSVFQRNTCQVTYNMFSRADFKLQQH